MEAEVLISAIVSALFSNFALLLIISKILNKKLFINIKSFLLCYLFLILCSFTLYYFSNNLLKINNLLRILLYYMLIIPICWQLFKDKLYKIIFSSFLAYLLIAASEMITAIILVFFVNNDQVLFQNYSLNIFVNILIFTFALLIASNKRLIRALTKITNLLDNVMISKILIASFMGIFLVFFILYCCYFKLPIIYLLITDSLFLCCYLYIIYVYFKEINLNTSIKKEYDDLLINITEYERVYNIQKMTSHEHKNQLMTIKGMIDKKNRKLITYIDSIISSNIKEDNEWFNHLCFIPNGGIRGILYYKIIEMKDRNINVEFNVGKKINAKLMTGIPINTNINLCKILGVILDNAIEAVEKEKEKNISIEFYLQDNKMAIAISNNYSGNIEFSKLGVKVFSTKGQNRGYGLRLVNYLVNQDNSLENHKEINGNIFTQIIKIRI